MQRVMHFASSRHPTDDFFLHFGHFDAKVRLEGGAAAGGVTSDAIPPACDVFLSDLRNCVLIFLVIVLIFLVNFTY